MIEIKNGNILDATEQIICHQVNVQGIMGAGVARQLADHYEGLEEFYSEHCKILENDYTFLGGTVLFYKQNNKIIANMFTQLPDFTTDYKDLRKCLNYIKLWASNNNLSICMPYKIRLWDCQR